MLKNFNFSTSDLTTCDELQIGDTNLLDQVQQRAWEYYNFLAGESQKGTRALTKSAWARGKR